jgi:serine-type D-Ala-D-Ala carboxypeptidase/endopeptidase
MRARTFPPARRGALLALLAVSSLASMTVSVAQGGGTPALAGDYRGTLGPLHLKLHLTRAADGALGGTLDSPDHGAAGLACSDFHLEGNSLTFAVPSVNGHWHGTIRADGSTLEGTWTQATRAPLTFSRDTFVAATKPSPVDGVWLGMLQPHRADPLRIQLTVKSDRDVHEYCSLDSPDQLAWGMDCANVSWSATELAFEVPVVRGSWSGKLSADGQELRGIWRQAGALPLNLIREAQALRPPPQP